MQRACSAGRVPHQNFRKNSGIRRAVEMIGSLFLAHKGSPPALPGWQKQFDVSGSRPPFKVPPREPPRTRRNFDDGRVRGICCKVRFLEAGSKIGSKDFKGLQMPTNSKN